MCSLLDNPPCFWSQNQDQFPEILTINDPLFVIIDLPPPLEVPAVSAFCVLNFFPSEAETHSFVDTEERLSPLEIYRGEIKTSP